jgi:hypothetical protein
MNASFQSGQSVPALEHLDADQLSAFVEGALSEHERLAAVAHLAECTHCRQVAFLMRAAEPVPEIVAASTAAPRGWRSWFAAAPLFGAATAGLIVTAVIAVAIHHQNGIDRDKILTTAENTNPQPLVSTPQAATAKPSASPRSPVSSQSNLPAPPPATKTAQPVRDIAASPAVTGGMIGAAVTPILASPPPSPQRMAAPEAQPQRAVAGRNSASFAALAPESKSAANKSLAPRSSTAAPLVASQAAAPGFSAPSNADSLQVTDANSAITTINAESVEALPLEGRSNRAARTRQKSAPLPSALAVASSVTAAGRTLALDAAGALFLSTDSGAHWTSIHPQWQGTAVAVAAAPSLQSYTFVQPQAPSQSQQQMPATASAGASLPSSQMPVPAQQFQLTTNSGAVWTSADGLFWQRR